MKCRQAQRGIGLAERPHQQEARNDRDDDSNEGPHDSQSSNIGGGSKPPNSRSISSASFIVVRSSSHGPTICTPTGRPSGEKPVGIAVAGKPGSVAMPGQD